MLRKRRNTIIFLIGLIVLVYFLFLKMTDSHNQSDLSVELEKRLSELKVEVVASDEALAKLEAQVVSLEKGEQLPEAVDDNKPIVISGNRVTKEQKAYDLATFSSSGQVCSLSEAPQPKTDVQMYNVIDSISFDDVDGGVWKQGYPIKVQDSQWTPEKPLKVFLIPHSHDDPGWLKTFDGYYSAQVKNILDNMVLKLRQHERMKFIYAEISFFSTWWKSATEEQKESVKRYISEGRFELVTGGWVMPDEAAAHYWAMLDQLIEGHSWIRDNLGPNVVPRSGWSIDPFGHSSTMPYILRQSGLRNMLVQRIHYSVKKYLSINKFLEFNWRQTWDSVGSTDILCHMMPFYSYDVPHTCGPDPKICCQFDFQRLPGSRLNCPWRKAPQPITDVNVHERAATLLDQYRKKSSLYKSNVVLIPLGDDFRYDTPGEWDKQYTNYDKLFTYMNGKSEWNVKAQFATLSDYFNELRKESGDPELSGASLAGFPTLSGDFFTYADRADHYWSGYFTSRPFYKHWDRHLESTLRSSEIIFSLAQAKAHHNHINTFQSKELYEKLTYARRSLGLFQHHDGITGTAKTFVVADYSERMLRGWKSAHEVIKESAQLLLSDSSAVEQEVFDVDWLKDVEDVLETRRLISLSSGQRKELVIYNSSPHQRQEVVRVWVSRVPISVYDVTLQAVECQVSPYFDTETVVSNNKFKLSFLAKVPALGMVTYSLEASGTNPCTIATVTYYNHRDSVANDGVFNPTVDTGDKLTIHNDQLEVELSTSSGMLLSMTDRKSNEQHPLEMSFIKYKSSKAKDHAGGAYLFIPTGSSQSVLQSRPLMRVIKGNLFHEVHTMTSLVEHTVRIVNTPGPESLGLEVVNIDTITSQDDTDFGMQLSSAVKDPESSDAVFYTDLNGFTMYKRKKQEKIQLQGNVYPMTSMMYVENDSTRLSVLAAQSAGVISLSPGNLQVILDRRLNQDDNRGLGQPVTDNKRTESRFYILFEKKTPSKQKDKVIGYPSLTSAILYQHLISPLITLHVKSGKTPQSQFIPLTTSFPCELNLLNMRSSHDSVSTEVKAESLLLVHHQATDCSLPSKGLTCSTNNGKVDIESLFKDLKVKSLERRTLTDLEVHSDSSSRSLDIQPMNIAAYKLTFE